MHILQQKILNLSRETDIGKMSLREIGKKIGVSHPQTVQHHRDQLLKIGFLKQKADGSIIPSSDYGDEEFFYSIPIVGAANCGKAVTFAEQQYLGYLNLSKKMLSNYKKDCMFAIKAIGNSMNKANVNGENIDDGDYVIVDKSIHNQEDYLNKYVLSVIDGMANIKKFVIDKNNRNLILMSESTEEYPPIYIHPEDFNNYFVNGTITKVIKKPTIQ